MPDTHSPRRSADQADREDQGQNVCVAVNIRPLINAELDNACRTCLSVPPGQVQVRRHGLPPAAHGTASAVYTPNRSAIPPAQHAMPMVHTVQVTTGPHAFTYDNVFGACGGACASSLYSTCVRPLVQGLFKG